MVKREYMVEFGVYIAFQIVLQIIADNVGWNKGKHENDLLHGFIYHDERFFEGVELSVD